MSDEKKAPAKEPAAPKTCTCTVIAELMTYGDAELRRGAKCVLPVEDATDLAHLGKLRIDGL